jgi:hypothetical protein
VVVLVEALDRATIGALQYARQTIVPFHLGRQPPLRPVG